MIDFETLNAERRRTAAESLTSISREQLTALGDDLFPTLDHPWRENYFQFIAEHGDETCYTGHTGDDVWFIYCPATRKGLWYLPHGTRGVGPLQARGLDALDAIIAEKN